MMTTDVTEVSTFLNYPPRWRKSFGKSIIVRTGKEGGEVEVSKDVTHVFRDQHGLPQKE